MAKLVIGKFTKGETRANGLIRINPNKPEFGSLMLVEHKFQIGNGFGNNRNITAFITANVADLEALVKQKGLADEKDFNELMGENYKIITTEKLESQVDPKNNPSDRGMREKFNPRNNTILTYNGERIFWKREVVLESDSRTNTLIQHDGGIEVTEKEAIERTSKMTGSEHHEGVIKA